MHFWGVRHRMITGEERLGIDMGEHDLGSRNEGGRCHVIDGPDNRGSPLPQLRTVQALKDWGPLESHYSAPFWCHHNLALRTYTLLKQNVGCW